MVVVCMSTDSYMTTWPGVWIIGRVFNFSSDSQNSHSVSGLRLFLLSKFLIPRQFIYKLIAKALMFLHTISLNEKMAIEIDERFICTPSMPGSWVGFLIAWQIPTRPIEGNKLQTYNRTAQHLSVCHPSQK